MQKQCTPDLETLDRLCRLANREAFAVYELRNSCIFTSATLLDVLSALGIAAELMRVETGGFGQRGTHQYAFSLGSNGDGSRLPAAAPGKWHGHLAVVADRRILLDATLDQIDGLQPFSGVVTDAWLRGGKTLWWMDGVPIDGFPGTQADRVVRYRALPGRGGWKGAPDFRATGRRRPVVEAILAAWQG